MAYYILLMFAKLIPGRDRREKFRGWARARFSVRAIVDAALVEQRRSIERTVYRTQMTEAPVVMTVEQTLDALIAGSSIARFGAGELVTMEGGYEFFQTPGAELTNRLRGVLTSQEPGLLVGIPSFTYELSEQLADGMREYCLRSAPWLRRILAPYLRTGVVYGATEVSLGHSTFRASYDRAAYFERCRNIWDGRKVTLIHGDGIFDGFTHDIFDNAASVEHVLAPSKDAFEHYDDIMERALRTSKDSIMIAILGPAATVLAYDLHRAGYQALDLGHIAKSYEWWREGRSLHDTTANEEFFAAD